MSAFFTKIVALIISWDDGEHPLKSFLKELKSESSTTSFIEINNCSSIALLE